MAVFICYFLQIEEPLMGHPRLNALICCLRFIRLRGFLAMAYDTAGALSKDKLIWCMELAALHLFHGLFSSSDSGKF